MAHVDENVEDTFCVRWAAHVNKTFYVLRHSFFSFARDTTTLLERSDQSSTLLLPGKKKKRSCSTGPNKISQRMGNLSLSSSRNNRAVACRPSFFESISLALGRGGPGRLPEKKDVALLYLTCIRLHTSSWGGSSPLNFTRWQQQARIFSEQAWLF